MIHVVWDQSLGGLEWLIIGGQRVLSTWLLELPHGMAASFRDKNTSRVQNHKLLGLSKAQA